MWFLWLIAALSVLGMVETLRVLIHDGAPVRPPRSRAVDARFLPPSDQAPLDRAA
ncbi:hypothetical protein [Nocardioides dongxiaopingii]|uniref:hypothetical protein n=1 Tax=Nocardioides TaxID=1839 RepID=UPI00148523AC|nr:MULTISPECIES: hypothetical protein [Nocardioides]